MKIGYLDHNPDLTIPDSSTPHIRNIAVELVFDQCDLNCPFCPNINLPRENIHKRIIDCLFNLDIVLSNNINKVININITGTELFQDRYDDETMEYITNSIQRIKDLVNRYNKTAHYQVTTHLIIEKIDRFIQLMDSHKDVVINTSYDYQGRFSNKKQLQLFLRNVYKLQQKGFVVTIDTVAHKLNINILKKHDHDLVLLWDKIYNDFDCDFVVWQNTGNNAYYVSYQELTTFLIYLYDHYPKIKLIDKFNHILQNQKIDFDCLDCIGIDGSVVKFRRCENNIRSSYKSKCVKTLGCLYCEYKPYCGEQCWCELVKTVTNQCWIKTVLNYIREKK